MGARFPVAGAFTGLHRSFLKGSAMEFAEMRDYTPGDDLRRLDWKAYARSDRFFLKEYESETNARVYFYLDTSGSMNFTTRDGVSRLAYAKRVVAHLSLLLLYQGDSVGVVQEEDGGFSSQRYRGESNIFHILEALEGIKAEGPTQMVEQLGQMTEQLPRRSIVVVVSDFFCSLSPLEEELDHMRHCAHEVTCLQVISEREAHLTEKNNIAFKDLETGAVVQSKVSGIKESYREKYLAHQRALKEGCVSHRAIYQQVLMEEPLDEALHRIINPHMVSG